MEEREATVQQNFVDNPYQSVRVCVKNSQEESYLQVVDEDVITEDPVSLDGAAVASLIYWKDGQEVILEGESLSVNDNTLVDSVDIFENQDGRTIFQEEVAALLNSTTTTTACFQFNSVPRGPVRVEVSASPHYYPLLLPLDLHMRPPDEKSNEQILDLGVYAMSPKRNGVARLLFGGDVMFDRRYFQEGLLHYGSEAYDDASLARETADLFAYLEPFLAHSADHTNVNLECPLVKDFSTPHPTKRIVLGCHAPTGFALPTVGIDSVTLANNHLYDYLEVGTIDTINTLDEAGLPWFGGGLTRQEARDSLHRVDVDATNGTTNSDSSQVVPVSLQGFTNFFDMAAGDAYTTFADDKPVVKGGAMPSFNNELRSFIQGELGSGRFPIPVIHGGTEYSPMQSKGMREDFETCALAGAKVIIAHHPHVVQGISSYRPHKSNDYHMIVGSLGNLVFDQDYHETYFGYLASVDMNTRGVAERMELIPYLLEGYIPRPIVSFPESMTDVNGNLLESPMIRAARRIAHMSTMEALEGHKAARVLNPTFGFLGAVPFYENGRIVVVPTEDFCLVEEETRRHTLELATERTPDSPTYTGEILAIHDHFPAVSTLASVEAVSSSDGAADPQEYLCEFGLDRLRVGGFESETAGGFGTADMPQVPTTLWSTSSSRHIQSAVTRTGTGAMVLSRRSNHTVRSSLVYKRRVDVAAGNNFTLRGFFRMENAGDFEALVTFTNDTYHETQEYYFPSDDSASATLMNQFLHPGGNVPNWTEFRVDMGVPEGMTEVEAYFRQYPPVNDSPEIEGLLFVDDISFIEWERNSTVVIESPVDSSSVSNLGKADLPTPNGFEFVRCSRRDKTQGSIELDFTVKKYGSGGPGPTSSASKLTLGFTALMGLSFVSLLSLSTLFG